MMTLDHVVSIDRSDECLIGSHKLRVVLNSVSGDIDEHALKSVDESCVEIIFAVSGGELLFSENSAFANNVIEHRQFDKNVVSED
jgi:hypothetical protein